MISFTALEEFKKTNPNLQEYAPMEEPFTRFESDVRSALRECIEKHHRNGLHVDKIWGTTIEDVFGESFDNFFDNPEVRLDMSSALGKMVHSFAVSVNDPDFNRGDLFRIPGCWYTSEFWFRSLQFDVDSISLEIYGVLSKNHRKMYDQRIIRSLEAFWANKSEDLNDSTFVDWLKEILPNAWQIDPETEVSIPREQHLVRSSNAMYAEFCLCIERSSTFKQFYDSSNYIINLSVQASMFYRKALDAARNNVLEYNLTCPCCEAKEDDQTIRQTDFLMGDKTAFHAKCAVNEAIKFLKKNGGFKFPFHVHAEKVPKGTDICGKLSDHFADSFGDVPLVFQFDGFFWYNAFKRRA
jgi:hypothetical protein